MWEVVRAIKSAHFGEPELSRDDLISLVSENTGDPATPDWHRRPVLGVLPRRSRRGDRGRRRCGRGGRNGVAARTATARRVDMSVPLLLDEMFSDTIAAQLRGIHHDVLAVVTDPALAGLPDDQILAHAALHGRALVSANIKDFMSLNGQYRASGTSHAGLILGSAKTFPQDQNYVGAVTSALGKILDTAAKIEPGQVLFLGRN